eukprot:jgi/Chrzof1/7674/Cz02g32150.t1
MVKGDAPSKTVEFVSADRLDATDSSSDEQSSEVSSYSASGPRAFIEDAVHLVKQASGLTDSDKQAVLYVLAQSPQYESAVTHKDYCMHRESDWHHCGRFFGISAYKQEPVPPEKVYKLRGITEIDASAEVIFDFVSETDRILQWDPLLQEGIEIRRDPGTYPVLSTAYVLNRYGPPGPLSFLCHGREFMMRVVGLELPDGSRVLVAYSAAGAVPGDPGVRPRTVRGHISTSGFVITPVEAGKCEVTMVVQVDPKGSVPTSVVNCCSLTMPMHLQRIRSLVSKLSYRELQQVQRKQEDAVQMARATANALP